MSLRRRADLQVAGQLQQSDFQPLSIKSSVKDGKHLLLLLMDLCNKHCA